MSIELMMPSNHLIFCRPLLHLPSIFPSIRVLSNESVLHIRWQKYWSFSLRSVLPKKTHDCSPLGWTGWISLQSKGLSRVFSNTTVQSINFSMLSFLYSPTRTPHPRAGHRRCDHLSLPASQPLLAQKLGGWSQGWRCWALAGGGTKQAGGGWGRKPLVGRRAERPTPRLVLGQPWAGVALVGSSSCRHAAPP